MGLPIYASDGVAFSQKNLSAVSCIVRSVAAQNLSAGTVYLWIADTATVIGALGTCLVPPVKMGAGELTSVALEGGDARFPGRRVAAGLAVGFSSSATVFTPVAAAGTGSMQGYAL